MTGALRAVERAAEGVARSRDRLTAAIRAAHAEGESLRRIAAAARLSHEQVRRIVAGG